MLWKLAKLDTSVRGEVSAFGGVGAGVEGPAAVAWAATPLSSEEANADGVEVPEVGGVGKPFVDGPAREFSIACSEGELCLNMASIWGLIACPNGVERNSAGKPARFVS